ncbi:MAG: VOC family protein [Gammaproteobacteria bacterium]|jgi:uncharacterized protein|nr:VOC family protein [Gammaproteobacteria bacterium]MBU2180432.1 VOC family protein [Gammaproteobacteria bacterium]MBU2224931.1 VOC family protein [Gammaproteobacteria bacterium]MBU2280155.1 VOC family protein [Gammaproteobacteria bacterium]MBU2428004.1 VOC family protein [Gammaproteobacteria bacterium]
MLSIFHLACHVHSLAAARQFYGQLLGCQEGRSTDSWVDFDFFGHQLSLHLGPPFAVQHSGVVDNKKVPMPHFGVVLPMEQWQALASRLTEAGIQFVLEPQIRFQGQPGEQATMFFYDPSGNPLEIKGFVDFNAVYAK